MGFRMAAPGTDRREEARLVRGRARAIAFGQRKTGDSRHQMARELVSHRRSRPGFRPPLYVLATDLRSQPRSQSRARTFWDFGLCKVKRLFERNRMPLTK